MSTKITSRDEAMRLVNLDHEYWYDAHVDDTEAHAPTLHVFWKSTELAGIWTRVYPLSQDCARAMWLSGYTEHDIDHSLAEGRIIYRFTAKGLAWKPT